MPNYNPADPLQPALPLEEGAVGGAEGAAGGADLRNSVNSLLDAMRDLLGNLQLPEVSSTCMLASTDLALTSMARCPRRGMTRMRGRRGTRRSGTSWL